MDREQARTERAIDGDRTVLRTHRGTLVLRKARQHLLEVLDRATAPAREGLPLLRADLVLLVKQPPDQRLEREIAVNEFLMPRRTGEYGDMLPFRMVHPDMEP